MKDYYDFSKGFKNPHAANLKKYGCTIEIHHGPPDGGWDEIRKISPEEMAARVYNRAVDPLFEEMAALEDYRAN
jgi:hypothetical protein